MLVRHSWARRVEGLSRVWPAKFCTIEELLRRELSAYLRQCLFFLFRSGRTEAPAIRPEAGIIRGWDVVSTCNTLDHE